MRSGVCGREIFSESHLRKKNLIKILSVSEGLIHFHFFV